VKIVHDIAVRKNISLVTFPLILFLSFCLTFLSYTSYLSLFLVTAYLSALVLLAAYKSRGVMDASKNNFIYISYLLFFLWLLCSILWSDDVSLSVHVSMKFYVCLLGLLVGGVLTHREFDAFLKIYILFALVMCVVSAYQMFVLGPFRPVGLFNDWNENGSYIVTALLPLAVLYVANRKYHSVTVGLGISLFVFSIGLTQSRGAFLGLALVLFVFFIVTFRDPVYRGRFRALLYWMCAGFLLENLATSGSFYRLLDSLQSGNISSSRLSLWDTAFNLYLEAPFFGSGVGTLWGGFIIHRFDSEAIPVHAVHNDYLQLLAEVGPVGLLLFCLFVFFLVRKNICAEGFKNCNDDKVNAFSVWLALIAVFVHIFFNFHLYTVSFLLIIGVFSGYLTRYLSAEVESRILLMGGKYVTNISRYATYIVVLVAIGLHLATLLSDYMLKRAGGLPSFDDSVHNYQMANTIAPYRAEPHIQMGEAIVRHLNDTKNIPLRDELSLIAEAYHQFMLAKERSKYTYSAYSNSAGLMSHYPVLFTHTDIVDNYEMAMKLKPNSLHEYLAYSDYLSSKGMKYAAWQVLEKAWGRWFYTNNKDLISAYCAKLITLRGEYATKEDVDVVIKILQSIPHYDNALNVVDRGIWFR
jgi:O-antigen ligase